MATFNGACKSKRESLVVGILHEHVSLSRVDLHAADSSLRAEQLPGAVAMDAEAVAVSHGNISAGLMAVIVVCSLLVLAVLVAMGIYKHKR